MDKSKWPQGPWTDEPDEETFEHAGLACRIIRRSRSGHLCGYVRVPEAHPLYGKEYSDAVPDSMRESAQAALQSPLGKRGILSALVHTPEAPRIDILFDVHGSLTFSGELRGVEGHWFGFDCAHAGDLQPGYSLPFTSDDDEYRDIEYVRAECRSLAEQLAAVAATAPQEK